jgi:hypothetical protein
MANEYNNMTDAQLQSLATQMDSILATGFASYGLTAPQAAALTAATTGFGGSLANVASKRAALAGAVQGKDANRGTLLENISGICVVIYNDPSVSDEKIADLGLQPRATTRTLHPPYTPQTLLATPYATGNVLLKWSRGQNLYGAVYIVETRSETGDWEQVYSTTRTRITLTGYTPGIPAWFRIKATRNGQTSTPSNESPIYHEGGGMQLQLAA